MTCAIIIEESLRGGALRSNFYGTRVREYKHRRTRTPPSRLSSWPRPSGTRSTRAWPWRASCYPGLYYAHLINDHVQAWWTAEMEAYGQGDIRVVLRVEPAARDELLRLTLKSTSEVEHTDDGGLVIRLYVDRWQWLIPLVTSYGGNVLVEEPGELRDAIVGHLRRALDAYENAAKLDFDTAIPGFRNDDSRLRSTRGRTLTE